MVDRMLKLAAWLPVWARNPDNHSLLLERERLKHLHDRHYCMKGRNRQEYKMLPAGKKQAAGLEVKDAQRSWI